MFTNKIIAIFIAISITISTGYFLHLRARCTEQFKKHGYNDIFLIGCDGIFMRKHIYVDNGKEVYPPLLLSSSPDGRETTWRADASYQSILFTGLRNSLWPFLALVFGRVIYVKTRARKKS